jgi:predicted small lipoprotein YifL
MKRVICILTVCATIASLSGCAARGYDPTKPLSPSNVPAGNRDLNNKPYVDQSGPPYNR